MAEEEIVEECARCEGTGVVDTGGFGYSPVFVGICPDCDGACYVPHACVDSLRDTTTEGE